MTILCSIIGCGYALFLCGDRAYGRSWVARRSGSSEIWRKKRRKLTQRRHPTRRIIVHTARLNERCTSQHFRLGALILDVMSVPGRRWRSAQRLALLGAVKERWADCLTLFMAGPLGEDASAV